MKRKIIIQVMIVVVSMCYVIGYSIAAETRNEVSMKSHKTIKIKEKEGIIPRSPCQRLRYIFLIIRL
jgi:hypothetical protein